MDDLFQPQLSDPLLTDNNGKASLRKREWKKAVKTQNRDAEFVDLINEIGGMPKHDEVVYMKSNGLSDTGSIFRYISNNYDLNELYLSTWIISRPNIEHLEALVANNKISHIYFVASTRLKQLTKSNYAFLVEQFKKHPNKITFKITNSHAKTFSVSTKEGDYFTVTGSGNWTENPRIENYVILNDKNAFDHNKDWMLEILKSNGKGN
jgi:hypothetical protein